MKRKSNPGSNLCISSRPTVVPPLSAGQNFSAKPEKFLVGSWWVSKQKSHRLITWHLPPQLCVVQSSTSPTLHQVESPARASAPSGAPCRPRSRGRRPCRTLVNPPGGIIPVTRGHCSCPFAITKTRLVSIREISWGDKQQQQQQTHTKHACQLSQEEEQQLSQAAPSSVDNRRNSQKSVFISGASSRVTLGDFFYYVQTYRSTDKFGFYFTRLRRATFKSYKYVRTQNGATYEVTLNLVTQLAPFWVRGRCRATATWKGHTQACKHTTSQNSIYERTLMTWI